MVWSRVKPRWSQRMNCEDIPKICHTTPTTTTTPTSAAFPLLSLPSHPVPTPLTVAIALSSQVECQQVFPSQGKLILCLPRLMRFLPATNTDISPGWEKFSDGSQDKDENLTSFTHTDTSFQVTKIIACMQNPPSVEYRHRELGETTVQYSESPTTSPQWHLPWPS